MLSNMIKVWFDVKKYMCMSGLLSGFDPIWENILFTPGKSDAGFQLWAKNGLRKIQDLYSGDVLMTFEDLTARHNIPRKHFF